MAADVLSSIAAPITTKRLIVQDFTASHDRIGDLHVRIAGKLVGDAMQLVLMRNGLRDLLNGYQHAA